jgi:hypothetical protein
LETQRRHAAHYAMVEGHNSQARQAPVESQVQAFWQPESYHHWIRSERELQSIIRYLEWNPVKAGLAESIEQWPWSTAYAGGPQETADDKIVRATGLFSN